MTDIKALLKRIYSTGITLTVVEDKLRLQAENGTLNQDLLAEIKANKQEILNELRAQQSRDDSTALKAEIKASKDKTCIPLTNSQKRLWFIDYLEGSSESYNMAYAFEVEGAFDLKVAEKAFVAIIERHETLRTVIIENNGDPQQIIKSEFDFRIQRLHSSESKNNTSSCSLQKQIKEFSTRPFDLSNDLFLRVAFTEIEDGERGILLVNMHHIASDGWSMSILISEFSALYEGMQSGKQDRAILSPLPIQYSDYALWQQEWLTDSTLSSQLHYWQKQLDDCPVIHSLPLDFPRPDQKGHEGTQQHYQLDSELLLSLHKIARKHECTLFMIVHAALSLVLSRHSYSQDIVIGTPVANRMHRELEPLIGFFANTLVLRTRTNFENFSSYLKHVRKVNLDAQSNQDVPFEQLVEQCQVPRSSSHTPLCQILLSMNNLSASQLNLPGVRVKPLNSEGYQSKFDLELTLDERESGLFLTWGYDSGLFKKERINQLQAHLTELLMSISSTASRSDVRLSELGMLSATENLQLTSKHGQGGQSTATLLSNDETIVSLFEHQVVKYPKAEALTHQSRTLTYEDLNSLANQMAHLLLSLGVQKGELVGICIERCPEMIIAILAVLKTGAAYVPLDPKYPSDRLSYMIKDSGLTRVVGSSATKDIISQISSAAFITINDDALVNRNTINVTTHRDVNREDLAYIIYTSGSTGQPKGVMVQHSGVPRLIKDKETYQFSNQTRSLQTCSMSFDAAVFELWTTLLNGGFCVLYPGDHIDAAAISPLIDEYQLNTVFLTTGLFSVWSELATSSTSLKQLITGGDVIDVSAIKRIKKVLPEVAIINAYGPTENTVISSAYLIPEELEDEVVPIGAPVLGTELYVVANDLSLTPFGGIGELLTGGEGVARGYLHRPDLTASHFIELPSIPGKRLYRTGDLVRYLPDGQLAFMGRADDQIKIRGFRVELGEISHALGECSGIESALVLAPKVQSEERQLVGYVQLVEAESLDINYIRDQLLSKLPEYMVPSAYVEIEQWPLTKNGKIDKKRLPEPEWLSEQVYEAPEGENELRLVKVMASVLGCKTETIGRHHSFFALGGHSLLAVKLVSALRSEYGVELPVRCVFDSDDVKGLAKAVDAAEASNRPSIVVVSREGQLVLSYSQQRLWFIDRYSGGSSQYNMPGAFNVYGNFDINRAELALKQIIARHEILRTNYREAEGIPTQVVREKVDFHITFHDVSYLAGEEQSLAVSKLITDAAEQVFDLSLDVLLTADYVNLSVGEGVLLFNMHHIVSDGWSMGILVSEFKTLYSKLATEKDIQAILPALPIQYADYAQWQREWLTETALSSQFDYWQRQLENCPIVHSLPLDYQRDVTKSPKGSIVKAALTESVKSQIIEFANNNDLTPFMLVHSALALVLSRHSFCNDIVIGTPIANRMQKELETLIGCFVNTLVLRTDTNHEDLAAYLKHIRKVNLDAQANQDVPFEQLVEHCQVRRSSSHTPLFQIMLTLNLFDNVEMATDEFAITPIDQTEDLIAKFDLDFNAVFKAESFEFSCLFNEGLFEKSRVVNIVQQTTELLSKICKIENSSKVTLQELPILLDEEKKSFQRFNTENLSTTTEFSIAELIHRKTEEYPSAVALISNGQNYNYDDLQLRSNGICRGLTENSISDVSRVGIYLTRTISLITSLIGVMKANATFVVLDPNYPQQRLDYMVNDADLDLIISEPELKESALLSLSLLPKMWLKDGAFSYYEAGKSTSKNRREQLSERELAYIAYTSGSTGEPKGVMVSHKSLANHIVDMNQRLCFSAEDNVLQLASFSFDTALEQTFMTLTSGATLYLNGDSLLNTDAFFKIARQFKITASDLSVAYLELLLSHQNIHQWQGLNLTRIVVGGEALPAKLVNQWFKTKVATCCRFFNAYGPTETVITSSIREIVHSDATTVTIGKVVGSRYFHVLDLNQQLSPLGAVGELYIGGAGLAQGYLNRPDL
ncbi:non-ribosomal peptide synthetase, partial [Pseudoalteromonas sp. P1-9]|uniref:non-ribosomal peptide synthetase n=1 Tax=Pseudoalteromonas sp. P1-9 TaxID=1710354 RepID=UPI000B214AA9